VAWREEKAATPPRRFASETYWARPVPGFGDPSARLLILGLAPAADGANRTGRVFTGDRSGDFLFAALHRCGYANQPTSVSADDGLALRGAWVAAAVRCAPPANKPTPGELAECLPWTVAELAQLPRVSSILCLGAFAWAAALRLRLAAGLSNPRPLPKFGHGARALTGEPLALLGCFHPSQQNTFTGKLTEAMIDEVLMVARAAS
jgi:uracil-DNA glycosylase